MSSQLPARPNLEHLHKQARALRKAHGSGDRGAAQCLKDHLPRLTDASLDEILQGAVSLQEAQLVVAREYGFPSWPRLVAAVEAIQADPSITEPQHSSGDPSPELSADPLPEHAEFSDHAKQVVALARQEAVRLGHQYIGTEHLLLGILADGTGHAVEVLVEVGVNLGSLKQAIEDFTSTSHRPAMVGEVPFANRARSILEEAMGEAQALGQAQVQPEHLLLALAQDREGVAAQVMAAFGADYRGLRLALLGEPAAGPQPPHLRPVSRPPSESLPVWQAELRLLSDADLHLLKHAAEQFLMIADGRGFVAALFPDTRTLLDLVVHEQRRRQA